MNGKQLFGVLNVAKNLMMIVVWVVAKMKQTLDIDLNPKKFRDKHYLNMIMNKIANKGCCDDITCIDSSLKGYHIIIKNCLKPNCDLCRFVFDDQERYRKDLKRKPAHRNVLFTEKHIKFNDRKQYIQKTPLNNT